MPGDRSIAKRFGRWCRAQRLGNATADAPGPSVLWPAILVALACLMMLGLQGRTEWEARTAQVRATEASLVNLASALTQNAEDTIGVADTALTGIVGQLAANGTSPVALSNLDQTLKAQKVWFSRFRDISVIGNDGRWLATSLPVTIENLADRGYFRRHRDEPGLGLLLSPPAKSVVTGRWTVTVSRRFNSADGGFAGIVLAAIELAYFVDHYATYDLGSNDFISLSTTDGTLLARYPSNEQFIGQTFPLSAVFSKWREHPSGSYVNTAIIDGVRRFTGYSRSDRYPLVVVAAMSEDQALAAWRSAARKHMEITFVLSGALGLLGLHLIRLMRRFQAAEEKARESEERFRLILETSVIEAIYMLDPDGNVESWNAAAERIKGYTPGEIIGQNFAVFFTPEDLARGEPARELGIARDTGKFATEAWRVRKDGSQFLARVAISAIRKDDGALRGFAKVTYDVTDRQIADEQRAIIIESAPNGMMIVDEAGIITLANSQVELIFGYAVGTLVGRSVDILVPEAFHVTQGESGSAFTGGRSDRALAPARQLTGRKRDGSPVTIEIMLSPVKTPRGRIVVASLFDITERTRRAAEEHEAETLERAVMASTNASVMLLARHLEAARDEAEEASRAKSRFLTGITHELRTPLHGIIGYAELLSLEGGLNSTQAGRVAAMMAAGEHLLGMINAVLDLSQIEADRLELYPDEIELSGFARICLDVVRPAAEAKGLALILAAEGPLRLIADPTRLRQVVINLLGNAIKFTPTGSVELRLQNIEGGELHTSGSGRHWPGDTHPAPRQTVQAIRAAERQGGQRD